MRTGENELILDDVLTACFLVLTAVMLVVSLLSYRRTRGRRVLLTSLVLTLFLVEGFVLTLGIFFIDVRAMISTTFFVLLDLAAIVILFVGSMRR